MRYERHHVSLFLQNSWVIVTSASSTFALKSWVFFTPRKIQCVADIKLHQIAQTLLFTMHLQCHRLEPCNCICTYNVFYSSALVKCITFVCVPSGSDPGNLRLSFTRSVLGGWAFRPCGAGEAAAAHTWLRCQMWAQTRYVTVSRTKHDACTEPSWTATNEGRAVTQIWTMLYLKRIMEMTSVMTRSHYFWQNIFRSSWPWRSLYSMLLWQPSRRLVNSFSWIWIIKHPERFS